MPKEYNPKDIEPKWQKIWEETKVGVAEDDAQKPRFYALVEFPYPSGDGLHVGHVRSYTALDALSRKRRMEGYNVLYPIGWDAFGLPTENYAIKTGKDPRLVTEENTNNFRRQLKALGLSFDWSREVNTTDPKYYKWTQWLFLKFLENDLAYKTKMSINWCPKDKIGLANEEVINGCCERCGTKVEKRDKEQWMLRITKYADRLNEDLVTVDYPERVKLSQQNWIGKSEGAQISFKLLADSCQLEAVEVFTTRPDTIFGATFMAIAPEVSKKLFNNDFGVTAETDRENKEKIGVDTGHKVINPATKEEIPVWVVNYVSADYGTGAIMGVPAHDERDFDFASKYKLPIKQVITPVFVDKVNAPKPDAEDTIRNGVIILVKHWSEDKYLLNYSPKFNWKCLFTGGIEANEDPIDSAIREIGEETGYKNIKEARYIPFEHIDKFHAPHKGVNRVCYQKNIFIQLADGEQENVSEEEKELHHLSWLTEDEMRREITLPNHLYIFNLELSNNKAILLDGVLMNSGIFDNKNSLDVSDEIIKFVNGVKKTTFKLRDWVFSRQRYWGEPIPVIHCADCGAVPVPEVDLPVTLPEVAKYEPTDNGESPLASIDSWVNTKCPKCGGEAKRETDTMPNWAGSSWYFLRYPDPHNDSAFASKEALEHWMPVDWYNGGMEHTTLHLLYSRFWNKFLFDLGLVPTSEPYKKRTSHGLILAEGGEKMSKSKGNVINPDDIINRFGADTLRVYEMFMGPFEQAISWSEDSLVGPRRFIERVWKLQTKVSENAVMNLEDEILLNQTVKKITEDTENLGFNTCISALMVYTNALEKKDTISKLEFNTLIKLLAPFAPHVSEELWALNNTESILKSEWPKFDENKLQNREVNMAIQINGKLRSAIKVHIDIFDEELKNLVLEQDEVKKWLNHNTPKKIIIIAGKVVNIVI